VNYRLIARRYFLVVYWLLFAAMAADWGQYPGLVLNRELVPYPWKGVGIMWALLGVEVAVLYAILRPVTFRRSWGRLALALLYAGLLVAYGVVTFVTDMPGYYYVPTYFAMATMLGLLVFAFLLGLTIWWRRRRARNPGG
jgi:hypothetical protein